MISEEYKQVKFGKFLRKTIGCTLRDHIRIEDNKRTELNVVAFISEVLYVYFVIDNKEVVSMETFLLYTSPFLNTPFCYISVENG